jgi:hypothetical protein
VIALTFSLPVSQFRAGKHYEIQDMLTGQWQVEYDDRLLTYEVPEDLVDMAPEGFGSLAYLCLSESGKRFTDRELASSRVVLFDFGGCQDRCESPQNDQVENPQNERSKWWSATYSLAADEERSTGGTCRAGCSTR